MFTFSRNEWDYLYYSRADAAKKYGIATVDGVNGLIFFHYRFILQLFFCGLTKKVLHLRKIIWIVMLNVKENIRPISYFRTNASDMMNFVTEKKEPVIITQNDESQAVLIDIESYQNMIDAFNMLKLLRFSENDIKNGRFSEASEVFARVKQKYEING